ncbi:Uncharacterized conserved protein, DUF305 family [Amycolatopsis marina]|uniref:Uncharacterized conserved protein, DUF305 family n=1 Tax=Amycolatopsis marina TaxID=490629 RepID=A0A1I1CNZ0_9PSEU|nr:DUF305 domain-containing protein [Amycolatopsis marina]SFB62608.1 Uncharacterized conserved protein, DUF305 family [Amycolatopsis marina]
MQDKQSAPGEESPSVEPPTGARHPRWLTALLAAGALLAAALLGATGGLLLADAQDDGSAETPNAVDVGFAQDMTVHHLQGVTMASWVRDHSSDPAIRQLAFDIESGQTEQVGRMQGWLGLWSRASLPSGEHMGWMSDAGHAGHAQATPDDAGRPMPGMATTKELARLRSLSGAELDVYFLQLMIRHHQGGGPMMRAALDKAEMGEVRNLAEKMLTAQTAEIEAMTAMLTERGTKPLPAPL